MIKFLNLIMLLFLVNSCQCQDKKNNINCNDESNVIQLISKLDEVKIKQNFIDSLTNHKKGLSYVLENKNISGKDCYRVKVCFNGEYHLETFYIFYVNKKNCNDIYIDETVSGDIISIVTWRNDNKNPNKKNIKMKTKQEYFEDLFNESSNIEFTPEEINSNKLEIVEFKKKLKNFEELNPTDEDFNSNNLRILINNEVFINSEKYINSSWLEYFTKKYKIDVKKLNELFNLSIAQEDFEAIKILIKHGYINSTIELKHIEDQFNYFKSLNGKIDLDEYYDPKYSKIEIIKKIVLQHFNKNIIKDSDGYTNLRKGKGTNYEVIEKINTGSKIEVLDNLGNWFYVKTKSGKIGYVHKSKIISE